MAVWCRPITVVLPIVGLLAGEDADIVKVTRKASAGSTTPVGSRRPGLPGVCSAWTQPGIREIGAERLRQRVDGVAFALRDESRNDRRARCFINSRCLRTRRKSSAGFARMAEAEVAHDADVISTLLAFKQTRTHPAYRHVSRWFGTQTTPTADGMSRKVLLRHGGRKFLHPHISSFLPEPLFGPGAKRRRRGSAR